MAPEIHRRDELARLRSKVDQSLTIALWLHVPLVAAAAWLQGNATFVLGGGAAAVASTISLARFFWNDGMARRVASGVGLVVMVSLLLAASMGSAWQTDIHMYYFAALAVLCAYCDRNVILAATAVTAVHHLVLSFVAPALVFSGGSDLGRVFLHAGILVIEAGALVWLTDYLAHLIAANATNLTEADAARVKIEAAVEAKDNAQRLVEETRHEMMYDLSARFEASIGGIVQRVASAAVALEATSQAMVVTAEDTTRQSITVVAASDEAARDVRSVGAATEELTTSIEAINEQITLTSTMIRDSVKQATMSNEQMRGLTEAADKIGDIVRIISHIARQTNLLALNATIEAARAGDAGKGFAVVATEVKTLASQTATATEEIAAQIMAIQQATQSSARLIEGIARTIGLAEETTAAVAAAVKEQGAATLEISRSVLRGAQRTGEISKGIATVNEAAVQTGTAAAEVLTSAGKLSRDGEALKAEVDTLLREIRAA